MTSAVSVLTHADGSALATYLPAFLPDAAAVELEAALVARRDQFKSGFMLVGELWRKTPRLVAEYGDDEFVYPDTGPNDDWPPAVREVRDNTERRLQSRFNYALANWYRDGRDHTGWHADKMQFHVPGSSIAMISLGGTRRFEFRDEVSGRVVGAVDLEHASLLLMNWGSQIGYEHSLRRDEDLDQRRLSLTLRHVLPTEPPPCTCGQG